MTATLQAATHTPGPWLPCSGDAGRIINIEVNGPHNDCLPVATLRGPDRKANARLIAAAPELLAALQHLLASSPRPKSVKVDFSYINARACASKAIYLATEGGA